jgi:adenylosuccinate synthase
MSLWIVVGGQFGSEGKGKVSAHVTLHEGIDICVRCGGPNSGHSFVDEAGGTIVLRQLPTGFVRSGTRLLIAAGALIDLAVLKSEMEVLRIPPSRIGIDRNAFIIEQKDLDFEKALRLRQRISSTLSGVGAAVSRRALRGSDARLVKHVATDDPWLAKMVVNVSDEVNSALDAGRSALIEGTQGFGLSLYHTEFYPHCTSRDTTAAGFLSEVGVSPLRVTEIVVVFRTLPIRVAGEQAGPLDETTWEQIRKDSGYPHDITEWTSVTRKPRRVGRFDWGLARKAVVANAPTRLALNGLDYLVYSDFGAPCYEQLSQRSREFIRKVEQRTGVPVDFAGVGPSLRGLIDLRGKAGNPPARVSPSLVHQGSGERG